MTLSGVIALILPFSPNSIALLANYVIVVEDKRSVLKKSYDVLKILSPIYSLLLLAITNPPCNAVA